jgi:hypothetical protein
MSTGHSEAVGETPERVGLTAAAPGATPTIALTPTARAAATPGGAAAGRRLNVEVDDLAKLF